MPRPLVRTCVLFAGAASSPFCTLPNVSETITLADNYDVAIVMHHGLYTAADGTHGPYPPWIPARSAEFRRWVALAESFGLRVCPYTSLFYCAQHGGVLNDYLREMRALRDASGCRGLYVDGLSFWYNARMIGDRAWNQPAMAALRALLGPDGTIVLHATHSDGIGGWDKPQPDVLRLASLVILGEGVTAGRRPEYLAAQVSAVPAATPFTLAPAADWPADERRAWLVANGGSSLCWVQMAAGSDGWTRFSCPVSLEANTLRAARVEQME